MRPVASRAPLTLVLLSGILLLGVPSAGDIESAARAFIAGDITSARTDIEAHLLDNPTDARALRLLTEIRIEEGRRARESGTPTPTRRAASGPEPAASGRPSDPARGFERIFGSRDGVVGKTVHLIRAWGDANQVEIEILASGLSEGSVERKEREIVISFAGAEDGLPRGEFALPAGPVARITHSKSEAEATVRVPLAEGVRVVSGGGGGRVYLRIVRDEPRIPAPTGAEGEYRAPVEGGGFSVRIDGDGQQGLVESVLPRPIVVRVLRGDAPAANVRVAFAADDPDIAFDLDPSTPPPDGEAITDTQGIVRAYLRLGKTVGRRVFRAMVEGTQAEASGEVYCLRSAPESIRAVSGSGQALFVRRRGGTPLVVEVTDRFGNPIPGAAVEWTFAVGNGRLDADPTTPGIQQTIRTDPRGTARLLEYTMGALKGRQVIQAAVSSGEATKFVSFDFDVQPVLISLDFFEVSVVDVIQKFGEIAGWNVALSQGVLSLSAEAQKVTVHFENAPAEEALSQILALKGLTRIETPDGTIKIVTFAEALRSGHPVSSGRDPRSVADLEEVITHTVRLQNVRTSTLTGLSALLSTNGILIPNEASNSLIITDFASNVRKILSIIQEIDQANFSGEDGRFLVVYRLRNISPTELQGVIDATIDVPQSESVREDVGGRQVTTTRFTRRIFSFPLGGQRQFIAFADESRHRQLSLLIDELDNEDLASSRDLSIRMYTARNADVLSLATWFRRNAINQPSTSQTTAQALREFLVVVDSNVIVFARAETLERFDRLWRSLDRAEFQNERIRIVNVPGLDQTRAASIATTITSIFTSPTTGQDIFVTQGPTIGTLLLTGESSLFDEAEKIIQSLGANAEFVVEVYTFMNSPSAGLNTVVGSGLTGARLMDVLTPLTPTGGGTWWATFPGQNWVTIFGPRAEVDRMIAACRQIDDAWSRHLHYELYFPRHRPAADIVQELSLVMAGNLLEMQPVASLNAFLFIGPPSRFDRYRTVIDTLDTAIPTRFYTPRNVPVDQIVNTLRTIFPSGAAGGASWIRIVEITTDGGNGSGSILLQGRSEMIEQSIRVAEEIDSSIAHVLYHGRVQHPTGMLNALVTATWPQLMTFPINVIGTGDEWMVIKGPAHLLPEAIRLCESVDTYANYQIYYPTRRTPQELTTILFDLYPHTGFTTFADRALVIQGERRAVEDAVRIAKQLDEAVYRSYSFEQAPSAEILRYVTNAFQSGYFRLAEPRPATGGVLLVWADESVHAGVAPLLASVDHPDFRGSRIRSWTLQNHSATTVANMISAHFTSATNNPLSFVAGINNVITAQGEPRDLDHAEEMIRTIDAAPGEYRIYQSVVAHFQPDLQNIASQFVPEVTLVSLTAGTGFERLLARGPRAALDRLSEIAERLKYPGEIGIYRPRRRDATALSSDLSSMYSHSTILTAQGAIMTQGESETVRRILQTARELDVEQANEFVPLLRASTTEAQTLLDALYGGNLTVSTVRGAGGLLLIGDPTLIAEARAKLAEIDRGLPWKQFRLRHTSAANMATAVSATFPAITPVQLTGGQGLILFGPYETLEEVGDFIRKIDSPDVEVVTLRELTATEATAPLAAAFPGVTATQIGALNSFVISGEPESVRAAKKFLDAIDRSKHTAIRPLRYYSPRATWVVAADVTSSIPSLQTLLTQYLSTGGTIQYDLQSNAFLITDALDRVTRILEIIDQLDQAPPQFLIEAVVAEVNLNKDEFMGVTWNLDPGLSGIGISSVNTRFVPTNPSMGVVPGAATSNMSLAFSTGNLQATVQAVLQDRDARVVTSPKIVTRNNVEAVINAGDRVAVITQGSVTAGGFQGPPTISFEDVPTRLTVTPTSISGADIVRLSVDVDISAVTGTVTTTGGTSAPNITGRALTTTVDIPDGNTLILGGLIRRTESMNSEKVPFLGDIPGIGALFRTTSKSESQRELLIFLSPRTLTSANTTRQMETELARYRYLVNFPVDWTGRRSRVPTARASGSGMPPSFVAPSSGTGSTVRMLSQPVSGPASSAAPAPVVIGPSVVSPPTPATRDLNTASSTQLATVPGLNPGTASLIVAYRAENGPFASVSQLSNVPGLTPSAIAQASPYLVIGGGAPETRGTPTSPRSEPVSVGLLDLNTADATALKTLPGVEEFHARMILAYRNTYGAFRRVEDLQEVPGITPELYAGLRNRVSVGGASASGGSQPLPVSTRIDLNAAGEAELLRAGLTQSQAKLVIAYRQTYGPYRAVEDLLQVPGITPEVLSRVRGVVSVAPAGGAGTTGG